MKKAIILFALLVGILVVGCDKTTNPCQDACGKNATCQVENKQAVCTCKKGYYGAPNCLVQFDKNDFMVTQKVCPQDETVQVTIKGQKDSKAKFNGFYVEVPSGTFNRCVLMAITRASGNIPDPNRSGKILIQSGIEVLALDPEKPLKDTKDGIDFNSVPVPKGKELTLFFMGHRAMVLFHNSLEDRFEDIVFSIAQKGVLATTKHLSPFYLFNTAIKLKRKISCDSTGLCTVDLKGTTDEGSTSLTGITVRALINGTMRELTKMQGTKYAFQVNPQEVTTVQLVVHDQYGLEVQGEEEIIQAIDDPCASLDCGVNGQCLQGSCVCDKDYSVKEGVCVADAPTIKIGEMPKPCSYTGKVLTCPGATSYQVTFTYTGVVDKIIPEVKIEDPADPGKVSDLKFADGKGSFTYTSSKNGGGRYETILITVKGPGGESSDTTRHGIF